MKFGENLKKLRKSRKLSQETLAEKVNVSRQSVSKWENSESYPEMNNILELCKIFHCHINDLVNDSIIDIDSLDEEIKMNVVKLKKEQQKKMKVLSKAISVIARIGRIAVGIAIPLVIVCMIAVAFFTANISVLDYEIKFKGSNDKITFVTENDETVIKYNNDVIISSKEEVDTLVGVKDYFITHNKYAVLGYFEVGLLFLVIDLVLVSIVLKLLENLFININKGDTPFTLENVEAIKKMAFLLIAVILLPDVVGTVFELLLNIDTNMGFEGFSLLEILFLFSMAYIFEYGYEIQLDSNGIMYDEAE